jgi:glycosyltransferase involved in cell wall biosynthesis
MIHNPARVALIKYGNFSHINEMILKILAREFPDVEIDIVDLFSSVENKDLGTIFHALKEYGVGIFDLKRNLLQKRLFTNYFYHKLRTALVKRLADRDYLFTFQTQSMFDASIPGTPHFLYTDHTALANLQYPGFDRADLPSSAWLKCEKDVYHHATINFTMSDNIANSIVQDYGCAPQTVINVRGGANIDIDRDRVFDDRRYASQNIVFVGVEWERKGGPTLIEAFKIVLDKFPNAHLHILGCTPSVNLPNCHVHGKVPLAKVSEYYQQSAVFCLPTRLEPFGIVFLEAMAHKLPVVATKIGAIPEFIHEGKNGYLVEPDCPQQLAAKLIELLDSPARCQAFGTYGHQLLWDTYTWEKTGARIGQNIAEFIDRSTRLTSSLNRYQS